MMAVEVQPLALFLRLYRKDGTFQDVYPPDRELHTAIAMAKDLLRDAPDTFYKMERMGKTLDGVVRKVPKWGQLVLYQQDAFPYYVEWTTHEDVSYEQECRKIIEALHLLESLEKQQDCFQVLVNPSTRSVSWKRHESTTNHYRFIKKSDAYALYNDLIQQDVLVITTNSHPQRKRG